MYSDSVTVFNRYKGRLGIVWYPTVLHGVNLAVDRAAVVATMGEQSQDSAILNIKYSEQDGVITVGNKPYLQPKAWADQVNDVLADSVTFTSGTDFDFFIEGDFGGEPISDDDYEYGFFDYMNTEYDNVFVITSVSKLKLIPHFEITGR